MGSEPYNLNEHEKEANNQNRVLAERTQSAQPPSEAPSSHLCEKYRETPSRPRQSGSDSSNQTRPGAARKPADDDIGGADMIARSNAGGRQGADDDVGVA